MIGKCSKRHRATEFLAFLKEVEAAVSEGLDVHLVTDNYATHKTEKARKWLARCRHWQVQFKPTSASRLNQVKRGFAEPTRKKFRRGVHRSVAELNADILSFIDNRRAQREAEALQVGQVRRQDPGVRQGFCLNASELGGSKGV